MYRNFSRNENKITKDTIAHSFKNFIANPLPLLLYTIILTLTIDLAPVIILGMFFDLSSILTGEKGLDGVLNLLYFYIVWIFFSGSLFAGFFSVANNFLTGKPISFSNALGGFRNFIANGSLYLLMQILAFLFALITLVALIYTINTENLFYIIAILLLVPLTISITILIVGFFSVAITAMNIDDHTWFTAVKIGYKILKSDPKSLLIISSVTILLKGVGNLFLIGGIVTNPISALLFVMLYKLATNQYKKPDSPDIFNNESSEDQSNMTLP